MDPNATMKLWRTAMRDKDWDAAYEAQLDIRDWLRKGGFEPKWTQDERQVILFGSHRGY